MYSFSPFSYRLVSILFMIVAFCLAVMQWQVAYGETSLDGSAIYHLKITGEIEEGVAAYVRRGIQEAERSRAEAIILEINTPGGRLDSALAIKDDLLETDIHTIAFVNRHALSAGALIAIATRDLYMVEGGVIGAATPVSGQDMEKANEKIISGVRKTFAATAERNGRNPLIAEAMVDETVSIAGLSEKGKLLSLTAGEAKAQNFSTGTIGSFSGLKAELGYQNTKITEIKPALAENFVRFITSSHVASLLLTIGMLALILEFKMAGWGIAGLLAVLCYSLFFWGHYLAGLAGLEDIVLVVTGLVLIGLEVFVVPGIGIVGMLGLASLLTGFYISLIGDLSLTPPEALYDAAFTVSASLALSIMLGVTAYFILFRKGTQDSGLVLKGNAANTVHNNPIPAAKASPLVVPGDKGIALSDLRPGGTALFGDTKISVTSEAEFIEAGTAIEIIKASGNYITVRILSKEKV